MNESSADKNRQQGQEHPIELIDCGRASEATRGYPLYPQFELGWPPNNRRPF